MFNSHFTTYIGTSFASKIPIVDTDPLFYVKPTNRVFSCKRINVQKVANLVEDMDGRQAAGLDKILCKLLKVAVNVVAPSFTCILNQSLLTGIYPSDCKLAKVSPLFKNESKSDLDNYLPISVFKIVYDQVYNYFNKNGLLTNCQSL